MESTFHWETFEKTFDSSRTHIRGIRPPPHELDQYPRITIWHSFSMLHHHPTTLVSVLTTVFGIVLLNEYSIKVFSGQWQ